jgi:hypothetical protein
VHHRQLGAIHFDDQHGNGSAQNVGKLQLHDAIALGLFPFDDIGADGFGVAFDSFGGDLQSGQQVQLLVATVEAGLAPYRGHHTPHSGRTLRSDYVQFPIAGAVSLMAARTEIVVPIVDYGPQHGQDLFGARFVVSSLLTAAAGDLAVVRQGHAQQPLHSHCPGVVHRVPHQQLDSLQIDGAALMPIAEDDLYDSAYFLGDFLLDCFCRFFSCGESVSSTGRLRQICSFTSTKDRLHC